MRGEMSRVADRQTRDSLAPKLRAVSAEESWRIAQELFVITEVLDDNPRLERALSDVSRTAAEKDHVVQRVIGPTVHPLTSEIMQILVAQRWSRAYDIANAVEDFGVDALMYCADATADTLRVSVELAQLHSALLNLPVVRSKLYDETRSAQARVQLLGRVLQGADFHKVTLALAEHATENLRNRRYLYTVQWLIAKFTRHMGEALITVTTAQELTREQISKLSRLYANKLGRAVHINAVVDPTVIGGMRIQVGDEVTDRTVVAQLEQLRKNLAAVDTRTA